MENEPHACWQFRKCVYLAPVIPPKALPAN
jgi:hypothetical protein